MKVAVISDPQIDLKDPNLNEDYKVLNKCFENMNVDSIVVCGDITEHGYYDEWDMFFKAYINNHKRNDLQFIPGNMDMAHTPKGRETLSKAMEDNFGAKPEKLYGNFVIDDCVFFGLAVEDNNDETPMSKEQLQLLDDTLKYASEEGVPAIVYAHYLLNDTIKVAWEYAYLGKQSKTIIEILEKYDVQVLFFTGHTHKGLVKNSDCTVSNKNNVNYFSTPSICLPDIEHYPGSITNKGTGYLIDISENQVTVNGYDFLNDHQLDEFSWEFKI